MLYARCIYQVLLWADDHKRAEHLMTRKRLAGYLQHVCQLLDCELLSTSFGNGFLKVLIDFNIEISIGAFADKLRSWTSAWIMDSEDKPDYWARVWFCPISPEDKSVCLQFQDYIPSATAPNGETPAKILHHIILVTSRARLLIPVKYRELMAEVTSDAALSNDADVIACSALRNHVHLLCAVPSDISIAQFVDRLKATLLARMLGNRHLRRVEGWSDDSAAYTVSTSRIKQEEQYVTDQQYIHRRYSIPNEMSLIYQRLDIFFFAPLH